jgi:hypothetical protein
MKVESEPDRVDQRFVVAAGLATFVITVLCCAVAWLVLRGSSSKAAIAVVHQLRAERPPAEVNWIEANLLEGKPARPPMTDEQHHLSSFGWSDRARGVIHIPVERAFDLYLAGERASGAPPERPEKP